MRSADKEALHEGVTVTISSIIHNEYPIVSHCKFFTAILKQRII